MWPTHAPPTAPAQLVSSALGLTERGLTSEIEALRLSGDTAVRVYVAAQLVSGGPGSDLGVFGSALARPDPTRRIVGAQLTLLEG